jgi:hypothetical protein
MLNQYLPWFQNIPWGNLLPWLLTFSLVAFVFSVFGVSIVLLRLPVDFLSNPAPSKSSKSHLNWLISKLGRNVLGAIFLIVGIIMLLTPGQGILSIVVGLMLLDFPGKQNLIRKILTKPTIFRAINRMRASAKYAPLHPHVKDQTQARG